MDRMPGSENNLPPNQTFKRRSSDACIRTPPRACSGAVAFISFSSLSANPEKRDVPPAITTADRQARRISMGDAGLPLALVRGQWPLSLSPAFQRTPKKETSPPI
eukprot:GHVO01021475.1.p1 GENE.GHVO01021475.1~~GHVO01021475.1.p1  ORF type:complete len:105 (+),score=8.47 GHVO01021475.1:136-450(+)